MSPGNMVTWISVFCLETWTDMIKSFLLSRINCDKSLEQRKKSFMLLRVFVYFSVTWEKPKAALEMQLGRVLSHSFSCFGMKISEASGVF